MKEQQFNEMNRVMDLVNKRLTKAVAVFVTVVFISFGFWCVLAG